MNKIIKIRTPFYSAGKHYRWDGNSVGIGIKLSELEGEGYLDVQVGDKEDIWSIDKKDAREFVEKYQSFYEARGATLGVIQWSQFNKQLIIKMVNQNNGNQTLL